MSHGRWTELRTRDAADPTIALLDAWAVVCDVLTFYNERLVQESFLGTAVEDASLQELGKLIGYRPGPGVAAETHLAFTLERPPQVPAVSPDPGLAPPTTPAEVTLPVGLRVQSIPGPGETPQTFETVETLTARPEWSSMAVAQTYADPPARGHTRVWLKGTGLGLAPGAALLISGRTPQATDLTGDHWDFRLLTEVTIDRSLDVTEVEVEWPLGSVDPVNTPAAAPAAHVLRKRFDVFGHNAPVWPSLNVDYRLGYARSVTTSTTEQATIRDDDDWHDFDATRTSGALTVVDLDGAHADVVRGSWVVVSQEDGEFYRELYEVVDRAELSRAALGISGTVTRLTLRGEQHAFGTPRQVTVFGVSEPLELTERPDTSGSPATRWSWTPMRPTCGRDGWSVSRGPKGGRGRDRRHRVVPVGGHVAQRRSAHVADVRHRSHPHLRARGRRRAGQPGPVDARRDRARHPRQRRRPA